MSQKLRLPIDKMKPTAGYKNSRYKKEFGYTHYGFDAVSTKGKTALYGLGDGYVYATGLDGLKGKTTGKGSGCGYCAVIIYEDCENNKTGKVESFAVTYMHLSKASPLKKGDKVTKDTIIGNYGETGEYVTGKHLHIQFDTDIKNALYCCGIASEGHAFLKHGTVDSTVNPCEWLWLDEGQTVTAPPSSYYKKADFLNIPPIEKEDILKAGDKIILNRTPLYASSLAVIASGSKTGEFYVWNPEIIKGRIRITNRKENAGVLGQVTGWVKADSIKNG